MKEGEGSKEGRWRKRRKEGEGRIEGRLRTEGRKIEEDEGILGKIKERRKIMEGK